LCVEMVADFALEPYRMESNLAEKYWTGAVL